MISHSGDSGSASERLVDGHELGRLVARMAKAIAESTGDRLCLIGVRSRGVPLANRIAEHLADLRTVPVPVGALDITLYRDDVGQGRAWPILKGTEIPFQVDRAEIVLVDDVMQTGRTTRAALNAVCDLGRPARIQLAVLIDRGGREYPIQPDHVGLSLEVPESARIEVKLKPIDATDEILRIAGRTPAVDRSRATSEPE